MRGRASMMRPAIVVRGGLVRLVAGEYPVTARFFIAGNVVPAISSSRRVSSFLPAYVVDAMAAPGSSTVVARYMYIGYMRAHSPSQIGLYVGNRLVGIGETVEFTHPLALPFAVFLSQQAERLLGA